jgi:general secretion pathway protein E
MQQFGYRGRTGIYELVTVDDRLRRLIHDRSSEQVLREHALAQACFPAR